MIDDPHARIAEMIEGALEAASDDLPEDAGGNDQPPAPPADGGDEPTPDEGEPLPEDFNREALAKCALLDPSDTDNGQRLILHFGEDLLVMAKEGIAGGEWGVWSGRHWDMASGAARAELTAQRIGPRIKAEAGFIHYTETEERWIAQAKPFRTLPADQLTEEQKDAKVLAGKAVAQRAARRNSRTKFGVSCKNASRIANMLGCAAPHLRVSPDQLNAEPLKVATLEHTLLFSGERLCLSPGAPDPVTRGLEDVDSIDERYSQIYHATMIATPGHARADYITALMPVVFDPNATCPRWDAFLLEFMPDEDRRRTLQSFTGLGLLGTPIQRLMFHYGTGANGKSVFLETISRIMGSSFAVSMPAESISGGAARNAGGASPDIVRLFGKRFLRVSELPPGRPVDIELVKRLTGGENIAVRGLYEGYFEFLPRAKAHWSGNDKPTMDGSDYAIFRRLLLMHWSVTIPEERRRDIELVVGEFVEEAPGILNWMIGGALDYLAHGLFVAEAVAADTEEYRQEMDPVGRFFAACVVPAPGDKVQADTFFQSYNAWAQANGVNEMKSSNKFGRLAKRRYRKTETGGRNFYCDIALRDVPAAPSRSPTGRDYD
jgi:putative DNA primase/helicase